MPLTSPYAMLKSVREAPFGNGIFFEVPNSTMLAVRLYCPCTIQGHPVGTQTVEINGRRARTPGVYFYQVFGTCTTAI
jgi:hypothetical protein